MLDINLRPPHYTRDLVIFLLERCDILKLNESELAQAGSWFNLPEGREAAVRALSRQFSIPTVIVTLGAAGATLLQQDQWYEHPGYQVTVADTIGSGDAFLAGFLSQTIAGAPPADALTFACAMGALVASYHGGCPDYDLSQLNALIQSK